MSEWKEIRKRTLQQQCGCECDMCTADPAEETTIEVKEME